MGLNLLFFFLGSVAPACVKVCGSTEAQRLQDLASERCSMPYRAPELFNVESYCMIDQRTDVWVSSRIPFVVHLSPEWRKGGVMVEHIMYSHQNTLVQILPKAREFLFLYL